MEKILIGLKQEMVANKKSAQPADGDMYWTWNLNLRRLELFDLDQSYYLATNFWLCQRFT